jgi:hypothetical protein
MYVSGQQFVITCNRLYIISVTVASCDAVDRCTVQRQMIGWKMNDELERIWKENFLALSSTV